MKADWRRIFWWLLPFFRGACWALRSYKALWSFKALASSQEMHSDNWVRRLCCSSPQIWSREFSRCRVSFGCSWSWDDKADIHSCHAVPTFLATFSFPHPCLLLCVSLSPRPQTPLPVSCPTLCCYRTRQSWLQNLYLHLLRLAYLSLTHSHPAPKGSGCI